MPLLEINDLKHHFPDGSYGLNGVNLTIEKGTFSVLAGANGSGKTLLMRHLNGLLQPTAGDILIDGIPIGRNIAETRQRIGLIFQEADAQIIGQTVRRDVAFGPENLGLPRGEIAKRTQGALTAANLSGFEERRPHTLSGGEKRRLAIAGVLAMEPEIVVLDEPFTGLDFPGTKDLLTVLDQLKSDGKTLLLITHDIGKVLAHADRLIVMEKGKICEDGTPEAVLENITQYAIRRPPAEISSMTWMRTE